MDYFLFFGIIPNYKMLKIRHGKQGCDAGTGKALPEGNLRGEGVV
jgi:hypothetical protein